jgi:ATP-binding cassette subfamily C exporter for protease/lipase
LGGRVLAPLAQLVSQWSAVVNVRAAWERLEGLLAQMPAKPKNMSLPAPKGVLTVESLMAGAPGHPVAIVRGVQFGLNPGEVLAVVGPSASGKTTLARLLVGLWPAMSGKVRLDGADIHTWDKAELGPYLGYLPQGVELLEGTLAENIARFGDVDMVQVEAAARLVGLHDLIMALPQGYNSPIGRDGAVLSGGQRQRVGLARALYGKPVFVVLDEPNSSLDEAGDADADGASNFEEVLAGTDPRAAESVLRVGAVLEPGGVRITCTPQRPGRRYQLEVSEELGDGRWTVVESSVGAEGVVLAPDRPRAFLHIRLIAE